MTLKKKVKSLVKSVISPSQKDKGLLPLLKKVRPFTMCEAPALNNLYNQGQRLAKTNIPGDIVECGCCNGGSSASVALGLGDAKRRFWLYDSFEGLPAPKEVDGKDAEKWVGGCVGAVENVKRALSVAGLPENMAVIRKGWFQDTFKQPIADKIALLHIDADWYDSVSLALNTFYDRVSEGGVIVLDDFGYWEGCREAFYDFCKQKNIKPLLERSGVAQAYWIKGKVHNRD